VSLGKKLCWFPFVLALVAVPLLVVACGGDEKVENTPGVSDSEIKIGTLLPMSQTAAAAWGVSLSEGMRAYFDYINDKGGIYGRKINFIVGDSQYTGPVASEAVRKLVEQDQVFAIQGTLGTDAESAVYKYLEENGVPDMYLLTGESKFTDPVARNRFGFLVDYTDEGRILGKYIADTFSGQKLGIIAQNDDFGKEGEQGLKEGIEENGAHLETVTEYYDVTQNDITSQVQRLKSDNVDVIGFYGMPAQAASLFKTARQSLSWDVPVVISGTDAVEIVGALAGYENIQGAVSVVLGHQAFETDVPGVAKHHEIMARYAPGVKPSNLTLVGASLSEAMVNLMEQAGADLTRASFLDAAESVCRFMCSTCLLASTTSPTDHRPAEVDLFVRAKGTTADTFKWEPFGEPYGFETTKDCTQPTASPGYTSQPR
jgi:branched-chain amino acid transport system substrate-binding protein